MDLLGVSQNDDSEGRDSRYQPLGSVSGSVTGSVGSLNAYNYRNTISSDGNQSDYDGPLMFQADSGSITTTPYSNLFVYGGEIPSEGTSLSFNLPSDIVVTPVMR